MYHIYNPYKSDTVLLVEFVSFTMFTVSELYKCAGHTFRELSIVNGQIRDLHISCDEIRTRIKNLSELFDRYDLKYATDDLPFAELQETEDLLALFTQERAELFADALRITDQLNAHADS